MDDAKMRAWWSHRQGLDGRLAGKPPAEVLEQTGWARSVGGSSPYLTLFARCGAGREAVDSAIARLEIHELPSARGCTYVLPASDFALGLKAGQGFGDASDMKTARKLGVTDAEVDKLCDAIVAALGKGVMDPDQIREATGGASRNLGPEGVKKGMTTTLPLGLGRLQQTGYIRRVPVNGRLDQQRYRYALWDKNPLAKCKLSPEEAQTELARRYFKWTGPATQAEYQWFSALGVKASKAALEPLKLEQVNDDGGLMFPEDCEAFEAFRAPKKPQYSLVSCIDGIVLLRRNLPSVVDAADMKKEVYGDKGLHLLGGVMDLPSNAIMDRGRVVGLWEYDTSTGSIAWMSFVPKDKALKDAVARTEAYIRSDLGDARSFSLDSPKSRAPRVAALRASA